MLPMGMSMLVMGGCPATMGRGAASMTGAPPAPGTGMVPAGVATIVAGMRGCRKGPAMPGAAMAMGTGMGAMAIPGWGPDAGTPCG
jgi:hypothetical protein